MKKKNNRIGKYEYLIELYIHYYVENNTVAER